MHQWDSQLEYMLLDTSDILIWHISPNLPLLCDYVWLCDYVIVGLCDCVDVLQEEYPPCTNEIPALNTCFFVILQN